MKVKGLMVIGTDTGVGKTYVTCRLLEALREQGISAIGMKPVASGMIEKQGKWLNEDVEAILGASAGQPGRKIMNPYAFRPFVAPHLAARQAGEQIELDKILACYQQLGQQAEMVIVESAGGLMTPLDGKASFIELAQLLSTPVLLVVAIRLGCINHALLTVRALQAANIPLTGWLVNYPDAAEEQSPEVEKTLELRLAAPCVGRFSHDVTGTVCGKLDLDQILDFDM